MTAQTQPPPPTAREARDAAEGHYVVARDGWSTYVLLGPYPEEGQAAEHVQEVRSYVVKQRRDAWPWTFTTDKLTRHPDKPLLPAGQLNARLRYAPPARQA